MQQGMTHEGAVRLAKERLGDATTREMAAYIREAFGLAIQPPMVAVLLGTLEEREALDRTGQAAYEKIERWKAENPGEAKRIAAAVKRREAAKRRKAEARQPVPQAWPEPPPQREFIPERTAKAEADLPGL